MGLLEGLPHLSSIVEFLLELNLLQKEIPFDLLFQQKFKFQLESFGFQHLSLFRQKITFQKIKKSKRFMNMLFPLL